jgi:hypothetical protein
MQFLSSTSSKSFAKSKAKTSSLHSLLLALSMTSSLSIALLSGCGDGKEVSFNSGGMRQTSRAGKGSVPDDLKKLVYPGAIASGSQSASETR